MRGQLPCVAWLQNILLDPAVEQFADGVDAPEKGFVDVLAQIRRQDDHAVVFFGPLQQVVRFDVRPIEDQPLLLRREAGCEERRAGRFQQQPVEPGEFGTLRLLFDQRCDPLGQDDAAEAPLVVQRPGMDQPV